MKLIVGLGNPGKEYENTRHNAGFRFIDSYAKAKNLSFNKEKFNGLYTDFLQNDEKIILLKPQKYMNLSGEVIKTYLDFFKIKVNNMLIIVDDLDTEVGKIKLRYKGSSGGHNGLKNIENHLKTQDYKRLKIGISNDKDKIQLIMLLVKFQ
ncbi:MAG: aminoacyl-tRNA hydrolase [Bacilli bacterium]